MSVISDSTTQDLYRGIREQLAGLLAEEGVDEKDLSTMSLGLSHSLSRLVYLPRSRKRPSLTGHSQIQAQILA